jgi:hypothetical protein
VNASLLAGAADRIAQLTTDAITKGAMQIAFANYAHTDESASIRRC